MKNKNLKYQDAQKSFKKMDDIERRDFIKHIGLFLGLAGIPLSWRLENMSWLSKKLFGSSTAWAQNNNMDIRYLVMFSLARGLNMSNFMGTQAHGDPTRTPINKLKTYYTPNKAIVVPGTHVPSVFAPGFASFAQSYGDRCITLCTPHPYDGHSMRNGPLLFPGDPGIDGSAQVLEQDALLANSPNYATAFSAALLNNGYNTIARKAVHLGKAINKRGQEGNAGILEHVGNIGLEHRPLLLETVNEAQALFSPPSLNYRTGQAINTNAFVDMLRGVETLMRPSVLKMIREHNRDLYESSINGSLNQLQATVFEDLNPTQQQLTSMGIDIPIPEVGTPTGGASTSGLFETAFEQPNGQSGQGHLAMAGAFIANLFKNNVTNSAIVPIDLGHAHTTGEQSCYAGANLAGGEINGHYDSDMSYLMGHFLKGFLDHLATVSDPLNPSQSIADSMAILILPDNERDHKQDFENPIQVLSNKSDTEVFGGMMGIFPPNKVEHGSYRDVGLVLDNYNPSPLKFDNQTAGFVNPDFTTGGSGNPLPIPNSLQSVRNTVTRLLGLNPQDYGVSATSPYLDKLIK
ncbi:MAG TPA: hypothetical protein PKC21_08495 [Oligoflexia bacterium]|nr:hypothetical protein [Oligoflexia bacterium]HMR25378.1 hypothetical protein [Oligoflexia bacterium]